ncbi:protein KRI1 homolog [Glandiceps talaboti]
MAEEKLTINEKYAAKYNQWRRKEEFQKLKARYGDVTLEEEDESSSEIEDEDASALTPQIEKDFLRALSAVKFKDPKIYQKDVAFYHSEESSDTTDEEENEAEKEKKEKDQPMYLKDYERKILVEQDGKFKDEDESEDDKEEKEGNERSTRAASPSYVEEQRMLKESFKTALLDSSDSEEEEKKFLSKREKTEEELEKEEEDYIQWLKGQKDVEEDERKGLAEMVPLQKYWTDPKLDDGERFLRDYILNKAYMDKDSDKIPTYGEIVGEDEESEEEEEDDKEDFSEEERQLEKEEDFERKFNFRFQEPNSDFVKRYPRTVGDSVRRKDNKRSEKRLEIKDRKIKEKEKKKEELKQLKNIKKKEILDKIEKLKQITGNEQIGFHDEDIEGDFDPEKHDQLMQNVFDNEYYDCGIEENKPEYNDEEFEIENWNKWEGEEQSYQGYNDDDYGDEEYDNYGDDYGPHCDDPDFIMDADYDPATDPKKSKKKMIQEIMAMSKKKKKKHSKFAEAVKRQKPVFDPSDKTFEEYFEEYYKLDYEDIIDDQPCRFKYRRVVANDFGLSTEEILNAKERELNQWASLKKTCQYRPEEDELKEVKIFQKKAKNEAKKKRVFTSLYSEPEEDEKNRMLKKRKSKSEEAEDENESNQPSQKKQKMAKLGDEDGNEKSSESVLSTEGTQSSEDMKDEFLKPKVKVHDVKVKKIKNKTTRPGHKIEKSKKIIIKSNKIVSQKKRNKSKAFHKPLLSDVRLRAYGINPRKLRYQGRKQGKPRKKNNKEK